MLARCPSCRSTFEAERTGRQDCPHCGKPLVIPEAAQAVPAPDDFAPHEAPPEGAPGTPWERRAELGMWEAWRQTLTQALFEPARLFRAARLDRGSAQVGFAVLTASVFWIAGDVVERVLFAAQREQMRRFLEPLRARGRISPWMWSLFDSAQSSPGTFVLALAFVPLLVLVLLYVNAAVTHAAALLLGQAKRGFPATLAACAYAFAPFVLVAIPGCGSIVALLWTAILTGIGLKYTHGIRSGGAAATVLAPYVLLCCAGCALSGAAWFTFSREIAR